MARLLLVIMVAQQAGRSNADRGSREPLLASLAGFILLGAILCVLQRSYTTSGLDSALDSYLSRVQQAASAKSEEEIREALDGDPNEFFKKFTDELEREPAGPGNTTSPGQDPRRAKLVSAILSAEMLVNTKPTDVPAVTAALKEVRALGHRVKHNRG